MKRPAAPIPFGAAPTRDTMMFSAKKTLAAGLAVLTLGTGVIASSAPASAYYRGGYRGGGFGGPFAAGLIGGLAVGAIAGSASRPYGYYGGGYGYGYGGGYGYAPEPVYEPCYHARTPVYDVYGNFAGYRSARVCN